MVSPFNKLAAIRKAIVCIPLLLGLSSFNVSASEAEGEKPHHRWGVGVFLGATHAHGKNESTVGFELGHVINKNWSIGAVVERAEREEHSTLLLVGLGWHPWEGLRLQLGAGRKDPSGTQENVLRTGITYDWEFAPTWVLKPYFALDFIENEETEEVFGFYFGKLF